MDYIRQSLGAYKRCRAGQLPPGCWALYFELFYMANGNWNLAGPVQASNDDLMQGAGIKTLEAFTKYRKELVEAGLITFDRGGSGRGNAAVYRLADLTGGRVLTGTLTAEPEAKPEATAVTAEPEPKPEAVVTAEPEPGPEPEAVTEPELALVPEPEQKAKKVRKKAADLEKRPYGDHGIIKLSGRDVELLAGKYPDWQVYIDEADGWLYRENKTKKNYYNFLRNWINRSYSKPAQAANPAPARAPEPLTAEQQSALALAQCEDDLFAGARAAREAAWKN